MRKISMLILAVAISGLAAGVASAHTYTPAIDRREARHQWRIFAGLREGDFTRSELRRIRAMEWRIRMMERRAKADGYVSARERAEIHRALNRASRMIYWFRHNDDDRRAYRDRDWDRYDGYERDRVRERDHGWNPDRDRDWDDDRWDGRSY